VLRLESLYRFIHAIGNDTVLFLILISIFLAYNGPLNREKVTWINDFGHRKAIGRSIPTEQIDRCIHFGH
jgi:hypothetical protein